MMDVKDKLTRLAIDEASFPNDIITVTFSRIEAICRWLSHHLDCKEWGEQLLLERKKELNIVEDEDIDGGYIYVVYRLLDGLVKIGYSIKPEKRIAQIREYVPDVQIYRVVPSIDGLSLEKELHRIFAEERYLPNRKTEWFFINDLSLIDIAIERSGLAKEEAVYEDEDVRYYRESIAHHTKAIGELRCELRSLVDDLPRKEGVYGDEDLEWIFSLNADGYAEFCINPKWEKIKDSRRIHYYE